MDAASIEQMNKVRVSLGMAPLPVPGGGPQFKQKDASESGSDSDDLSTLDKRQAAAGGNWQKLEAERQEKLDRRKRKEKAKKARDREQQFRKLEGKGLGDADEREEALDTRTWIMQQKKRQKKIDKARMKMEDEYAAREQQAEYTSKDLAGVNVAHEADDFDDTAGEQVLTLKDAEIGDESEEDELENEDLKAQKRLEEKLKLKKKQPDYDPTEPSEAGNVLSKYDEEIDGKKQKRFTIDGEGNTADASRKMLDADGEVKSKGVKINLDMLKDDVPISDYLDPSTIKVKKPKKKKEKKTRQKAADDDDIFAPVEAAHDARTDGDAMEVDGGNVGAPNKKRTFEFDDDDLQSILAEQRRQALKKRKKMDTAELARQMREEMPVDDEEFEDGGMTIDETTEFVANLKKPEAPEVRDRKSRTPQPANADSPDSQNEDEDGDTAMTNRSYADIDDSKDRKHETSAPAADITATGLEDEDSMSGQGLGASLAMLRKRGLVSSSDDKLSEREGRRSKFLAEKQHLIDDFDRKAREQREQERRKGTWDKMSNRDRELYAKQQNEARERYLNQLLDDEFRRNYKPTVELRYTDEFGRSMNQKEAFKHMSHMFHGKGSGKQKTEKRLKKIEDEKREMGKGVLNIGVEEGGMMNVQGREGRRQKQAGVRLQ